MARNDDVLERIDSKLTALLALVLDSYLQGTDSARRRDRSIDRLLIDAGLSPQTVARLLGKTDRAVYLMLQREDEKKTQGKATPAAARKKKETPTPEREVAEPTAEAPRPQGE